MRKAWGILVVVFALGATVLAAPGADAIVGGSTTPGGAYTFMASVQSGGAHFCGGSVIASQWVLTAAHCMTGQTTSGLTVRVGSNDNTAGGVVIPVDAFHVDPAYDGNYDVALLHLASAVPLTVGKITLAPLGDDTHEADGTLVTVAGWGDWNPVTMGLLALPQMRDVQLKVVSDANCGLSGVEADTQVCAAALLKDSCQGDSGGPLFWKGPLGQRIQIGVVSHGFLCAIPEFPGSYGEVNNPQMRDFIDSYVPGV
ncbi:MAG TPA: serine protease [Acidimicrobiales bacterium]|nr:serine protease [Acidimicrobiales bacterium]